MLGSSLKRIKNIHPTVHCITNYVTANDCANALIAIGASPIMADEPKESAQITSKCSSLVLNIGTLNESSALAMLKSGKTANQKEIPVIFDPVGVGVSKFRTEFAENILNEVKLSVIKGNVSEIKALAGAVSSSSGVDAGNEDAITAENLKSVLKTVKSFAAATGTVVAVTGKTDIVTDGSTAFAIHNGDAMLSDITGSGCMLGAMLGAFVAVEKNTLLAAVSAVCALGLCGETAAGRLSAELGNASFRNGLIDALYRLDEKKLSEGANYEFLCK